MICTTIRSDSTVVPPVTDGAVTAGLADHRSRLAGDRRLVDARDALDDVAVAGNHLAGLDDDVVAEPQVGRGDLLLGRQSRAVPESSRRAARHRLRPVRRSVSACALPRPSATASARLAKTTVSQSHTAIDQPNTDGSLTASTVREDRADLDDRA